MRSPALNHQEDIMATTATADKPAEKPKTRRANGAKAAHRESTGTGALIAAGAAGAVLGIAAMIGRKVAVQAPTALAGDWDDALAAEHAVVDKIFDALEMTTRQNTTKRAILLAQLKHALAKHALQEENTVYPALRDSGETEAADHLNQDHGYVKQYLYELTNCPKDSERFLEIVRRFRTDLDKHVREEEDVLFPALKASLSEEANKALTFAMNKEGFKLA
jgi:hemerythrin superfamily protein